MNGRQEKKERKSPTEREIDKFCLQHLGYSPDTISEVFATLDHCETLANYYFSMASGYSESMKQRVIELVLRVNEIYLDFDQVFIDLAYFINEFKKQDLLSEKIQIDAGKAQAFKEKVEQNRKDVKKIYVRANRIELLNDIIIPRFG